MYTELIFGAKLKKNTPKEVIDTIKYIIGDLEKAPENLVFETSSGRNVLRGCSYYFGVHKAVSEFYYDEINKSWTLSSRANIKNYENEIEQFLRWIKPFIEQGSGSRDIYAITIYEEDFVPDIYYLKDKDV